MSYTHYSVCLAELMRGIGIATPTHGYKPEQAFVDGQKIADKITQLQAEVESLRKDAEWKSIETAPKDGAEILVFFKSVGIKSVSWTDTDWDSASEYALWCVDDNKFAPHPLRGYSSGDEMCWMHLPKPPAIKGEQT
jgi:hypothetical protein